MNEQPTTRAPDFPEPLPAGERTLWQGAPDWRCLARRALHVRALGLYFGALIAWRLGSDIASGATLAAQAAGIAKLLPFVIAGLGLPIGLAWLIARTTRYTITNRRIVLAFGIALPISVNIPFRVVASAAVKCYADGTGNIPVVLNVPTRLGYLVLWPHVRPWRLGSTEPMLRAIPQAASVASILAEALAVAAQRDVPVSEHTSEQPVVHVTKGTTPAAVADTPTAPAIVPIDELAARKAARARRAAVA